MCPNCHHFMCDRDERRSSDGFTFIICHRCGMGAMALYWAQHVIDYRIQQENQLLRGKPAGHA